MTTRTVMMSRPAAGFPFIRTLTALALLVTAGTALAADAPEFVLRSTEAMAKAPAPTQRVTRNRGVKTLNSISTVTQNDTFLVASHGFQDLAGNCLPRGWTGQDLTSRVFAHVSGRFTINDSFLSMGTRALWFGADSTSALDEITQWVRPYGYGNGWNQRLTSPTFSRTSNPGAVLRFDAALDLRRADVSATSFFTPFGLASGKVGNDALSVQALRADGTWATLNGRFAVSGGPAWNSTPPLYESRIGPVPGAAPPVLAVPNGCAVDDSGYVYIADRGNNRIVKTTNTGVFITQWGVTGSGPGQMSSPFDVAVDHAFNVYVVDQGMRVQKFDRLGNFILQWGSPGAGIGQFNFPVGLAVDLSNNIYVADQANQRIQKFTSSGSPILQWGSSGTGIGQFNGQTGMAVDPSGTILYVADSGNHRIQAFTLNGSFIRVWGSLGVSDGQFNFPSGVDCDRDGNVWIADRGNNRIQKFTSTGSFLLATGVLGGNAGHFFNVPRDVAIMRATNDVYVCESGNNRVQYFSIGGPVAGEQNLKYEVRLDEDGNQLVSYAEPTRLRVVMQSNAIESSEDGKLLNGQPGVTLVDNVTLKNPALTDILAPLDFESGTTGAWTLSAVNQAANPALSFATISREFGPPATSVALRSNFDPYDPSCAWTFLSPGDTLANGTYARLVSPWFGIVPGDTAYAIRATTRLNSLLATRFLRVYTRGKLAGDTKPREYHMSNSFFFGTSGPESTSPLLNNVLFEFPQDALFNPTAMDSIQIVFEVVDQSERLLGTAPEARPVATLPIIDDVALFQTFVDSDYDGVADALDACPGDCAAGQDANGDGCVDTTATLHHVESWAPGNIHYRLSSGGMTTADQTAIRAAFNEWRSIAGAAVPLVEDPVTTQVSGDGLDGINLVTRQDPEVQFPPGVLAITPTTSFTRRSVFDDRIVLPGEIVDSDLFFNPQSPFTNTGEANKFDLQSVATHEIGHMIGLVHSGTLDATMFFVIQPGNDARSLTDDDRSAAASAYPAPSLATDYGTIQGTIYHGQTGEPLGGALVSAVRLGVGGALMDTTATDYSAENGTYALRRLPPGGYSVRITPLDGNVGGFPLTAEYISQRLTVMQTGLFVPEWWTTVETNKDDPTLMDPLTITAGQTRSSINVITTIDTIPPTITSVLPANAGTNVGVDTPILVNFSEPIIPASLEASFRLRKDGLPPSMLGTGQLRGGTNFLFTPNSGLEFGSHYEIEISPALKDLEGVALADTFRAVFDTQAQPPLSITDVQPRSAPVGALVTITGTGIDSLAWFAFTVCGACPLALAPGSQITPTSMVVRVPQGAITGGITLSRPTTNEISNTFVFTVLPPRPQVAPVPSGAPVALGGIAPRDAAVSPDGATAYAAGDGGVAAVNVATRAVTLIAVGAYNALALAPDGSRLVATDRGNPSLHVLGAIPGNNLGNPLALIPMPDTPGAVAISPNGRRAYVTGVNLSQVFEVDLDPQSPTVYQIRRTLHPPATLTSGIAVSLDGSKLYLTTSNLGLIAMDATTEFVTVLNPTPNNGGVAITPSGSEVLAPGAAFSNTLVLAILPLNGPPAPVSLGVTGIPRDIGVTPEGQSALVVNSQTNELHVLDVQEGSSSYHSIVSTVGTGATPLGVGVSSLSPVVAVANFGDHSLSLYATANADNGLQRIVSDLALPGDQVAVHSSNDFYVSGTTVDLEEGGFASDNAIGTALTFTVPTPGAHQHATTLTLQNPSGTRSLSLPFTIVDPITTFTPRAATLPTLVSHDFCTGPDPDQGLATLLCSSPDGALMAMNRSLTFGDCNLVDFMRATPFAERQVGENLTSATLSHIAVTQLCWTPDSKRLWVIRAGDDAAILDADPASITFGQNLGNLVQGGIGRFPYAVGADPLNRYMVVSTSDPGYGPTVALYNVDGTLADTTMASAVYQTVAVSRDGRNVVLGGGSGVAFYSLTTHDFLPTPPQNPGIDNVLKVVTTTNGKRAVGLLGGSNIAVWNLDPTGGTIGANLYFGHPIAANLTQLIEGSDGHSVILGSGDANTLYKLDVGTLPPTVTSADVGQPFTALTRSIDGRRLWGVNSVAAAGGLHDGDLKLWNLADAAQLTLVTGGGQAGQALTTLPVPFRVRVTGADGRPQAGVVLRFSVVGEELDGVAGVFAVQHVTDANGEAAVTWVLPGGASGTANLTVEALGGTAAPLIVPAQVVDSDADIIPAVTLFGPIDGATGINAGTSVFARFNQPMNTDTLPAYMHLEVGGVPVAGSFSFQDGGRVAVFKPTAALLFGSSATIVVQAGAKDLDAQASVATQSASFTVQAPPALSTQSLSPPSGHTGATVIISGTGFSPTTSNNVVTFNGVLAPVRQASLTSLTTAVPVNATSGPVIVQVGANSSAPLQFSVLAPDADPGTVVGDVNTGEGVSKIAFTHDGLRAYVTNPAQNSVTSINVVLADVITQTSVGLTPQGIAILPDDSRAYVANKGSGNVSVIDIRPGSNDYNKVINTIHVGDGPVDVAVSAIGPKVFVANSMSGTVSIIDANPGNGTFDQVVTTVNTGSGAGSVAISPDGGRMYVGTAEGVVMVDLTTFVVTTVNTGSGAGSVAISPDGTIVIALLNNGTLVVIDAVPGSATFNQVVTTVNTGSGAGSVAISPDGGLAYVTSPDGNTVLVFQIGHNNQGGASSSLPSPKITLTLIATIPVGQGPKGVALSPSGIGLALVANAGSGTVTFIGTLPPLDAVTVAFEFNPNSLNLKSMGKWVEGTITPSSPFTPSQIDVPSVRLNGVVAVDPDAAVTIAGNALKVRFSRAALQLLLPEGDAVPVTVTGMIDRHPFTGLDHVKVKSNKVTSPHQAEVVDPAAPYTVRWTTPSGVHVEWVALLHSLDHGVTWVLDASHLPNNGSATWNAPLVASDSVKLAVVEVESTTPGDTLVTGFVGVSDYFRLLTATSVEPPPVRLEFLPIAPSPSRGSARLHFGLPRPARVELSLYDVMGRKTRTLVSGDQEAGWHDVFWDGATDDGSHARSGLYFARLRVEGREFKQRMIWIH